MVPRGCVYGCLVQTCVGLAAVALIGAAWLLGPIVLDAARGVLQ